jgi:hypothetical protein
MVVVTQIVKKRKGEKKRKKRKERQNEEKENTATYLTRESCARTQQALPYK